MARGRADRPLTPAPRWQTTLPPRVVGSWGPDVAAWARAELHLELDAWQQRALNRALAVVRIVAPSVSLPAQPTIRLDGERLAHRRYLISTGRQQGKTVGARAVVGWALTAPIGPPWSNLIGLAHDKGQARKVYEPVLEDLRPIQRRYPRGGLALTRYLGIRSDLYGRHREYNTGSRDSRNQVRGGSFDLVLFDEVRTQVTYDVWNAVEPTTTARPDPLILELSTAGGDTSVLLRDHFDRALRIISGEEPFAGFGMTWYAANDDDDPADPAAWARANPAVASGRLSIEVIRESLYSLTPAGFRNERLNLWAEGVDDAPVPALVWRRAVGRMPDEPTRVVLGVEAVPSWRRFSITVALLSDDGVWVAVAAEQDADRRAGKGAPTMAPHELIAELDRMAEAWQPDEIAFSKAASAAPHLEAWAEAPGRRVKVTPLGPRQLRQASELFRSELIGGRLTHLEDPLLAQQARLVRASGPLVAGDWYLSIRASLGDVDAIRAAAWASWAAIAPEDAELTPQVFVRRR